MMPCTKTFEDLSAFVDGEMAPEEELALRRHLDTCISCQGAMKTLSALKETVARTAEVHPLPRSLRGTLPVHPGGDFPGAIGGKWHGFCRDTFWSPRFAAFLGCLALRSGSRDRKTKNILAINHIGCGGDGRAYAC